MTCYISFVQSIKIIPSQSSSIDQKPNLDSMDMFSEDKYDIWEDNQHELIGCGNKASWEIAYRLAPTFLIEAKRRYRL